MPDSYDREVVRQETSSGEPVRPVAPATPVTPATTSTTSRTAVYREGGYNSRAVQAVWWIVGFIDVLIAIRPALRGELSRLDARSGVAPEVVEDVHVNRL